jgi:periplasmic protein TonB
MAFEAFRAGADGGNRPRARWRTLMYVGSVAVHVGLILVGVAYSFWHVEELSPPRLKLTFMAAAPPPPPPPPPPEGGGANAAKKKVPKVRPVEPKQHAIVQPKETPKVVEPPKEEPKPGDGQKAGVIGGTIGGEVGGKIGGEVGGKIGGDPGGKIGGTGTAPAAKMVAPAMGAAQLMSPQLEFPRHLAHVLRDGLVQRVLVKICVTTTGAVDRVTLSKGADPRLDEYVLTNVKAWRYRPLTANAVAVPFCYPAMFEFKPQ